MKPRLLALSIALLAMLVTIAGCVGQATKTPNTGIKANGTNGTNVTCTDSDGGLNYALRGTCYGARSSGVTDFCQGSMLNEYQCVGNSCKAVNYTCPYGCANGACNVRPPASCSDSDGGLNYYTYGFVNGTLTNGSGYTFYDVCNDNATLAERYCNGTMPNFQAYTCMYDCNAGACLNNTGNRSNGSAPIVQTFYVQPQGLTNSLTSYMNLVAYDADADLTSMELHVRYNYGSWSGFTNGSCSVPNANNTCALSATAVRNSSGVYGYRGMARDMYNHIVYSSEVQVNYTG